MLYSSSFWYRVHQAVATPYVLISLVREVSSCTVALAAFGQNVGAVLKYQYGSYLVRHAAGNIYISGRTGTYG